jgi:dTDP-4-dehydrorhamnose reductase
MSLIDAIMDDRDVPWGTYHFCGAGPVSRHRFAEMIMESASELTGRRSRSWPSGAPTSRRLRSDR